MFLFSLLLLLSSPQQSTFSADDSAPETQRVWILELNEYGDPAWAFTGKQLILRGRDGRVLCWAMPNGKPKIRFEGEGGSIVWNYIGSGGIGRVAPVVVKFDIFLYTRTIEDTERMDHKFYGSESRKGLRQQKFDYPPPTPTQFEDINYMKVGYPEDKKE